MAMVGAYVLAGELKAAGGDHAAAFAAYEKELRDHVTANQRVAIANLRARQAQAENGPEALVDAGAEEFAQVVASFTVRDY